MTLRSKQILIYCLILMTLSQLSFAKIQKRSLVIQTEADLFLKSTPGVNLKKVAKGIELYFSDSIQFPLQLSLFDSFGAPIELVLQDPSGFDLNQFEPRIIKRSSPNGKVNEPPLYCSRLIHKQNKWIYDAKKDPLNHYPRVQFSDSDFNSIPNQNKLLTKFDDKNTLTVSHVKVKYDYEDNSILDYKGKHPVTKKEGHLVYEGNGGYYANFHYAILPYHSKYLNLPRQKLLQLVQGKLPKNSNLLPKLKTHSFLPGPYKSKNGIYELCEWGDSSFAEFPQELTYNDLLIWDWDLHKSDKLFVVVWEGDEEDWMIADGLLDPYYLTDDVVGTFVVTRKETLKGKTYTNKNKDFEITLKTSP